MEYRNLGRSGLKISALSFGSWVTFGPQMNEEVAAECMHRAYDAGVNFFDNAEIYADGVAEEIMGAILARSGWNRSTYLVSTKIFWGGDAPNQLGLSRKHIVERLSPEVLDAIEGILDNKPEPEYDWRG